MIQNLPHVFCNLSAIGEASSLNPILKVTEQENRLRLSCVMASKALRKVIEDLPEGL